MCSRTFIFCACCKEFMRLADLSEKDYGLTMCNNYTVCKGEQIIYNHCNADLCQKCEELRDKLYYG
jgi:hypothetical protein